MKINTLIILILSFATFACNKNNEKSNTQPIGNDKSNTQPISNDKSNTHTKIIKVIDFNPHRIDSLDYDGDGTIDTLLFNYDPNSKRFILSINERITIIEEYYIDRRIEIVDIDTEDNLLEIAVPESDMINDYVVSYYCYFNDSIRFMGRVEGYDDMFINGTGAVIAHTRSDIFQEWYYDDPYQLDENHMLVRVPQEFYRMYHRVKLNHNLVLYTDRESPKVALSLEPGDNATIVSTDNKEWFYIKSSKGNGWFSIKMISTAYDVFD